MEGGWPGASAYPNGSGGYHLRAMNLPAQLAPLVRGVHHIAIVVESIAQARKVYEGVLGLSAGEPEFVPEQKVNMLVTHAGAQGIGTSSG